MEILKNVVLLLVGFVLLIKGADYFVEGSSAVAKKFKIPSIVVGLTIVAMGTSLPELAVSLSAALNGSNEIAISNVVGSNIFNLIVVLGVCAVISPIAVDKSVMKRDMPFMLGITALLVLVYADFLLPWTGFEKSGELVGLLSRFDGVILLVLFVSYLVFTVRVALKHRKEALASEEEEKNETKLWLSIIFIVGGIIAIKFGGDFVVDSASKLATTFGMSETLVGLTIVAVGTSLPELVTSIVAARKNETSLAIGNVVGSNIFNILFILGISSTICPINVIMESLVDTVIVLVVSLLVFVFGRTKDKINRTEGTVMVLIYVIYMVYAIIR
ncbi:MAG: calcium/sodium antiporter [Lachnospiraceae bacterium]|nr:calcium/sodium antiporter [Lachnospiraceae bacterium]